jgi:2-isopropylmalate synthase
VLYDQFLKVADRKKEVEDEDLKALANQYQAATV